MRKVLALTFLITFLSFNANAAEPDKNNKTPEMITEVYYEAINNDDFDTIKNLYSEGYYNHIVTRGGYLESPDETLFEKHAEQRFYKSTEIQINERRNAFFKNNPEGVYSVLPRVILTNEYVKIIGERTGFESPHVNDELCFKLVDGEWKITDKIKGY